MSGARSAWTDARRAEAEVRHLRALLLSNETLRGQLEDYTKRNVALLAENERLREVAEAARALSLSPAPYATLATWERLDHALDALAAVPEKRE